MTEGGLTELELKFDSAVESSLVSRFLGAPVHQQIAPVRQLMRQCITGETKDWNRFGTKIATIGTLLASRAKKSKFRPKNYVTTAALQLCAQNTQAVKRTYGGELH